MKRKVVRHGPSTLIVSLPAKWAKNKGLKEKDEVEIIEDDNQLIISASGNKKKNEVVTDITGLDRTSLVLLMHAIYRAGFSKVTLLFDKPETVHFRLQKKVLFSKTIHHLINRFIGFEIARETDKSIEIVQVSYIDPDEVGNMISRTFLLLKDMVDSLYTALIQNDRKELEKIEDKHDTLTRMIGYLLRAVNRGELPRNASSYALTHILANVDKIADIFKYLVRERAKSAKISRKMIPLLKVFKLSFEEYVSLTRKYDEKIISNISRQRDEYKQDLKEIKNALNADDYYLGIALTQSLELLFDLLEWRMYINLAENRKT